MTFHYKCVFVCMCARARVSNQLTVLNQFLHLLPDPKLQVSQVFSHIDH